MEPIKDITQLDPNKDYEMTAEGWVEKKDPGKEKWYKIAEAAKELGVQTVNIRNAIHRGSLIAKEIPGTSPTGYVYMISETSLAEYLDDPKKVRDPKKREKYNKHQYDNIKKKNRAKESEKIDTNEKTPVVVQKEEVAVKATVHHIPDDINDDLANIQLAIADLMTKAREEAYDEAYKKGFEDGKLSVEHESKDEYRKGYEQGKKEAKAELLAALKVM